jgi:uncharacterized membrane protein YraQ (UPF0718 family)
MHLIFTGFYQAAAMLWEILWALVLGFAISAVLQVFVSKETMVRAFGSNGLRPVLLAMAFGAASSSCSYAAAAATNTVFKKGAAFIPAIAFMIASTNLVVELGMVLWILMGWRFVLAEAVGAFVMVGIVWLIFAIHRPSKLIDAARAHEDMDEEGGCCHHHHEEGAEKSKLIQVADAFVMDWSMLWKEILVGVLIAGFFMVLVPASAWQALFVSHGSHPVRLVENALLGPLVALASFVCSVGNIPLASLLWSSGATFGGVIAFLYGDLIVLPLIVAYRKYYGWPAAIYITLVLYASMALAGIVVDLVFAGLGLIPAGERGPSAMAKAGFAWNYSTWLDLLAIVIGTALFSLHFRGPGRHDPASHEVEKHVHDH